MSKFHNTEAGPKICKAKPGNCPIGGEHFTDSSTAQKVFDKKLNDENNTFSSYSKKGEVMRKVSTSAKIQGLNNDSYYGCEIDANVVEAFKNAWKEKVGTERAKELESNKAGSASGSGFHVTVLTPKERRKIGHVTPIKDNMKITCVGVGTITSGDNTAWYVVCESPEMDEWRATMNLPPKDFHITLGFDPKDVYDKFKGRDTLITV